MVYYQVMEELKLIVQKVALKYFFENPENFSENTEKFSITDYELSISDLNFLRIHP